MLVLSDARSCPQPPSACISTCLVGTIVWPCPSQWSAPFDAPQVAPEEELQAMLAVLERRERAMEVELQQLDNMEADSESLPCQGMLGKLLGLSQQQLANMKARVRRRLWCCMAVRLAALLVFRLLCNWLIQSISSPLPLALYRLIELNLCCSLVLPGLTSNPASYCSCRHASGGAGSAKKTGFDADLGCLS